jgi:tryptophan halogenase
MREGIDELFRPMSWQSVSEGMGLRPESYCPRIDNLDYQLIEDTLKQAEGAISGMVQTLPTHDSFLRQRFRAL